jgi:hypothetical protein
MSIQQNLLSSGEINWLNAVSTTVAVPAEYQRTAIDANGNVYNATFSTTTKQNLAVNKYDSTGNLIWTSTALFTSATSSFFIFGGIVVDSSGNVYITGTRYTGTGLRPIVLCKWNSSGTFQWANFYGLVNSESVGSCLCVDSSDNVYISAYLTGGSGFTAIGYSYILKVNSSGAITWSIGLSGANTSQPNLQFSSIAVDSSNNVYAVGYSNDFTASNAYYAGILVKYNSSGAQQWKRRIYLNSGGTITGITKGLAIDSSDNIYVSGVVQPSATYGFIAKYNTSGSLQSYITPTTTYQSSFPQWFSLACDKNGILYAMSDRGAITAYTSSLSAIWANSCQESSTILENGTVISAPSGKIFVCGGKVIANLPSNGIKTGSYTVGGISFVYSTNTIGSAGLTLTEEAATLIAGTPSFSTTAYSTTSSFSSSVSVLYI